MRLIDADNLELYKYNSYSEAIRNAPTITPESLAKRGRWIADWFGEGLYACSDCGKVFDLSVSSEDFRFCPYCGCRMVEDTEATLTPTPASDVEGE